MWYTVSNALLFFQEYVPGCQSHIKKASLSAAAAVLVAAAVAVLDVAAAAAALSHLPALPSPLSAAA